MEKYFETIGKEMPYLLPDNFFETNEKEVMQRISALQRKHRRQLSVWIGGAMAAAILIGIVLLSPITQPTPIDLNAPLYSYNESMSNEEVQSLMELYEADIFLSYE